MRLHGAAALLLLLPGGAVLAQEETEETGLSGKAAFGFTQSRGNTDNLGTNFDVAAEYKTAGPWTYDGRALFVKREEDGEDTDERYEAVGTANYYWSERMFAYGRLQWRKDLFGGVREEYIPTAGLGRILIDTGAHKLKGEIGAGYKFSELDDGTDQDNPVATGGLKYTWKISENAQFIQNVLAEWTQDNTYAESETALRTTIIGSLGAKFSYVVKHNTDVTDDKANTDFYTTVALDYAF
jgi:putative salt-induced outer membrane protein